MDENEDVVTAIRSIFGEASVRLAAGEFVSEQEYISAPGRCCVIHFLQGHETTHAKVIRYIGVAMQPLGSGRHLVRSVGDALARIEKEAKWTRGL